MVKREGVVYDGYGGLVTDADEVVGQLLDSGGSGTRLNRGSVVCN